MPNKNKLKNPLELIKYKKKPYVKEFYLPETEEEDSNNEVKDKRTPYTEEDESAESSVNVTTIEDNEDRLKKIFNLPKNKDVTIRHFTAFGVYRAFIVYIDGMADTKVIDEFILKPLMKDKSVGTSMNCPLDYAVNNTVEISSTKKATNFDDVASDILTGDTGIYIDGCNYYIICETKGYEKRGIEKPQAEGTVRGSQEGFTENFRTNVTLLRRILKNGDFIVETVNLGKRNKNLCGIAYMKGIVNPALVKEVKRRLNGIETDFIGGSGMIEQFIEDRPFSPIPTILTTERPDRTANYIIEGRVAIISEGTPFALIVPVTLSLLLQSPEDTFLRWQYGTLLRFIRIFAVFIAVLLPALYISITNYHQEMIPTELLIAIVKARENVPFPTILEVLLMEASFELIREAGIRIPGIIGNTIGIIGALIIGQAAVQANLVSPILIIVIAITGLGNFAVPDFSTALGMRLVRIAFIFAAAALGLYGVSLLGVALGMILVDYKSFGVPFLAPVAPKARRSFDLFIRYPVWKQEENPDVLNAENVRKQPKISRKWTIEDPQEPQSEGDNNDKGR